jgi:tRNA/rRNA methyltransferase
MILSKIQRSSFYTPSAPLNHLKLRLALSDSGQHGPPRLHAPSDTIALAKRSHVVHNPPYTMLPNSELTEQLHIILVEPQNSLNIGSVARAMMNLGFKHLHLVRPHEFSIEKALVTGRWAEELVRSASIHDSLEMALSTMNDVVGFSSLSRPTRGEPTPLPEWIQDTIKHPIGRTALLFGREDTGLPSDAIEQCRLLVRIPSHGDYPAFNLAQSALLVMYEFSRTQWSEIPSHVEELPSWNQYNQLDRVCTEVMAASGFRHHAEGDPTAALIKGMFRRIQMNESEIRVMLAFLNRIRISLTRNMPSGE